MDQPTKCTAITAAGQPCRGWAVRNPSPDGRDPPRCGAHGGGRRACGGQPGNQNARKHGYYARTASGQPADDPAPSRPSFFGQDAAAVTVDHVIVGLVDKLDRLDGLIADFDGPLPGLLRLFGLYARTSNHLSRLLRDRHQLSDGMEDLRAALIGQALDELGEEWGVEL